MEPQCRIQIRHVELESGFLGLVVPKACIRETSPRARTQAVEREPLNLEFPFSALDRWLVPNERFYVRSHFAAPKIDPATWRLRVEGAVDRPLELTLDEIKRLPSETRPIW